MTFDEHDGTYEGRAFPDESEWLDLQLPELPEGDLPEGDLPEGGELISADFVQRTLAALRDLAPEQLDTFVVPPSSSDFV